MRISVQSGCPETRAKLEAFAAALPGVELVAPGTGEVEAILCDPAGAGGQSTAAASADIVRDVIANERFRMLGQPIADVRSGRVVALEALARVDADPPQPPDRWLADAEIHGLRPELELALLGAAVRLLGRLPEHVALAVNVSASTAMHPLLAAQPDEVLSRLVLELTDHHTIEDYEELADALKDLRARGTRVAVDDSGQGLQSLHQIARLSPDWIKLNRHLTRNVGRDATRSALAYALVSFATSIGTSVIAEGIETEEELHALRGLGVPFGQGYLLARPADPAAFDLGSPLPLPAVSESAPIAAPAVVLPARAQRDFREAVRYVVTRLARRFDRSTVVVAQIDHATRRWCVIASKGPAQALVEPGLVVPLEETLCHAMASGRAPRLCSDAASDPVYGSLARRQSLGQMSYLGVPLELADGSRVGVLSAGSGDPDAYTMADLQELDALAHSLTEALVAECEDKGGIDVLRHMRDIARRDELTGALNAAAFLEVLGDEWDRARRSLERLHFVRIEVADLESIYNQYGHAVAELVLKDVAQALNIAKGELDVVGRIGDGCFAALLIGTAQEEAAEMFLVSLEHRMAEIAAKRDITAEVRAGHIRCSQAPSPDEAWPAAGGSMRPLSRTAVPAA